MLLALPIGTLVGLSLGSLGGGGSILTIPALVYLLSVSPHSATTASLIIVAVTSLVGVAAHLRAGRVQVRAGIVFGVLGAGGAFAGSRLSASISPDVLLAAFSVVMVVAAVTMLRRRRASAVAVAPTPASAPGTATLSPIRVVTAATVVGLVTGFFGVGGGFVVVPALVLALSFDMPTAVGTSLLVIAINSVSALIFRLGTHAHIGAALLLAFTAAAVIGAVAGSRLAARVRPQRLVGAFAILMIAVAVYTAARSFPSLL